MSLFDDLNTIGGWLKGISPATGYINLALGLTNFILGRTASDPNRARYDHLMKTIDSLRSEIEQGLNQGKLIEWSIVNSELMEPMRRLIHRGALIRAMKSQNSDPHSQPPVITAEDKRRFVASVLDDNIGAEADLEAVHQSVTGVRGSRPLFQAYYEALGTAGMVLFFRNLVFAELLGVAQIILAWELEGSRLNHTAHEAELRKLFADRYARELYAVQQYLSDPPMTRTLRAACSFSAQADDPDGLHEIHRWVSLNVRIQYPGTGNFWFSVDEAILCMSPGWRGFNSMSNALMIRLTPLLTPLGTIFRIHDYAGRSLTVARVRVGQLSHEPPFVYPGSVNDEGPSLLSARYSIVVRDTFDDNSAAIYTGR